MRIVITGSLGLIGQNLAHIIRKSETEAELVSIDWLETPQASETEIFDQHISACFASPMALEAYHNADVIIHLAASVSVQESVDNPLETFHNNATKVLSMMEFLRSNRLAPRIIFASTGGAIVGDFDGPIDETTPAHPKSPYGASKLAAEAILDSFSRSYGFSCASLRFANVYGPRGPRAKNVISLFCESALSSNSLCITGDGEQTRDFIYSEDIAAAILAFINTPHTGVFQLGTEIATSINDLAAIYEGAFTGQSLKVSYVDGLAAEVRHNVSNTTKVRETVGFTPKTPLEEGILETLEWYRINYDSLTAYRA